MRGNIFRNLSLGNVLFSVGQYPGAGIPYRREVLPAAALPNGIDDDRRASGKYVNL
jgi:hypothetical protein